MVDLKAWGESASSAWSGMMFHKLIADEKIVDFSFGMGDEELILMAMGRVLGHAKKQKIMEEKRRNRRIHLLEWFLFLPVLLGMLLGSHFECFYVINSFRNLCCACCDRAIMSGEGGD